MKAHRYTEDDITDYGFDSVRGTWAEIYIEIRQIPGAVAIVGEYNMQQEGFRRKK